MANQATPGMSFRTGHRPREGGVMADYWFGGARSYATIERTVAGLVVVFRSLAVHELIACDMAAQLVKAPFHVPHYFSRAALPAVDPRAVFSDDEAVREADVAVLLERVAMVHDWPGGLANACHIVLVSAQETLAALQQEHSTQGSEEYN